MKYPCCRCCCGGQCRYERGPATGHTEPCPNQKKDKK